ncbi:hypothetical protein TRFO_16068 [Tritrichomonas foetus]|uniref:Uncharacterized protein n=1 Tax=Tritrichomonas foetus TaxID=1144522 RepID=A0A1J4KR64_9EUKA|nr:hypothetical protein TRFO_16068 [Tritrichomonas foetus]|eukprot:OHT13739.1 hypothetical protein TRFO_16068 [Tritrichomonas foetus]
MSTFTSPSRRSPSKYAYSTISYISDTSQLSQLSQFSQLSQINQIEKNYPEFVRKTIDDLKEMKRIAGENQDFEKTSELQNYIELRAKENTSHITSISQDWLEEGILEAIENFEYNISQIKEEQKANEEQSTSEFEESLFKLKVKHKNEINKLGSSRSTEIDREKNRMTAEVRQLIDHSKHCAKANDIKLARKIQNEAAQKQAENIDSRTNAIETKYKNLLAKTQKHHENEEEALKAKYDKNMQNIKSVALGEIVEQKRKLTVFIIHSQQRAISDGSKELIRKEMRTKFAHDITNFVWKLVNDHGKSFVFETNSEQ